METTIIATVYNEELGTASVVADIGTAFSVALFDSDAEEYVPTGCTIFPKSLVRAEAMAWEKAFTV